jgi:DDE superfamily endonuclease
MPADRQEVDEGRPPDDDGVITTHRTKEPAMALSHLPASVANAFEALARWLDRRSAARLPLLMLGILFACRKRTVTSWFRAAGITADFRQGYVTACAVGRSFEDVAISTVLAVEPLLGRKRLLLAIDDTHTPRYGPEVEGCGIHHDPCPGPAGGKYVYGHVWVTLAALARHEDWGTIALPLQAQLYVRRVDLPDLPPERPRDFRTKLEMAVDQLLWIEPWVQDDFERLWVVVDGGYAKRPFLQGARRAGFTVVSRLRKDAALCSLPLPKPAGRRGPQATYGKGRISLAKRAGQTRGWEQVECEQYGKKVTKTIKTFLATWRPAGGVIRVVLVKEEDCWLPFFGADPEVTAVEILEAMADRNAEEQVFKDEKGVWGAGQQQVRNVHSSEGCFNLNLWMYSLVEAWAWGEAEEGLVDRSASPWDTQPRRPSHEDKRKALQRVILRAEIEEALAGRPTKEEIRELAERLLAMAA